MRTSPFSKGSHGIFKRRDRHSLFSYRKRRKSLAGRTADALKTLEQKRLIERRSDEYDKRKVIVFITDDGKSLIEKRRNEAREKIAETLLLLGDDDAKEFMRILSKINSFR